MDADGKHFNRRWGYLSRCGVNDKSQLMRQIEKYADIYTSRVSNFLRYTPFVYFRWVCAAQQAVRSRLWLHCAIVVLGKSCALFAAVDWGRGEQLLRCSQQQDAPPHHSSPDLGGWVLFDILRLPFPLPTHTMPMLHRGRQSLLCALTLPVPFLFRAAISHALLTYSTAAGRPPNRWRMTGPPQTLSSPLL